MNEQDLREMIYEFGQRLSDLRYSSSSEPEKVDSLLHTGLMHYDKSLSEAVLRLILKIRFEDFDDETENKLQNAFLGFDRDPAVPFKNTEEMDWCWPLAAWLVDTLVAYTKFHERPAFSAWCSAIPNQDFAEFVNTLFEATQGELSWSFFPEDVLDWVRNNYSYEGYSTVRFWLRYVNYLLTWIAKKCPKSVGDSFPYLFDWAAELIKYSWVAIWGEGAVAEIDYPHEILLWDPPRALISLCRARVASPHNEDVFPLDDLRGTLDEISRELPGELHDQLMGLFYTHNDHEIRAGALMLMPWEQAGPFQVIDLAKNINNIKPEERRQEYGGLLPTVDEFRDMYGLDTDFLTYNGCLEKLQLPRQ